MTMMMLLRRSGWPLVVSLSLLAVSVNAQFTVNLTNTSSFECSDGKAAECLLEFRTCYQEECYACIAEYVAIPEAAKELEESDNVTTIVETLKQETNDTFCVPIDELKLALYDRVFKPLYYQYQEAGSEERLQFLLDVARYVSEHNRQIPKPSYELGLTPYSADTPEEAQRLGGYRPPSSDDTGTEGAPILAYLISMELQQADSEAVLPEKIDWVEKGAVTSVKNQGRCGGCWSISVAGAIEGAAAITSDFTYLQSVSFQQLISCDKSNDGCSGGFPATALLYANNNPRGGTATLNDYPFSDEAGETTTTCAAADHDIAVESQLGRAVTYYGAVGDDTFDVRLEKMKQGVARQPVAIAIKSECKTIKNYRKGVLTEDGDCSCTPQMVGGCLDHAVLIVGYDDTHDPPFWKIKNSWGTDWGEDGYFYVAQFNPHSQANSWGLFGVLAEGIVPLQAFNLTQEVFDEPQTIGLETWEKVLIGFGCFAAAAILGVALAICKNKMCPRKPQQDYEAPAGNAE